MAEGTKASTKKKAGVGEGGGEEEGKEEEEGGEVEENSDIDEMDDDEVMKLLEEAGGDGENALDEEGLGLGQGSGLGSGFMKAGKRLRDSTRAKASSLPSPGMSAGGEKGSGGSVIPPQVLLTQIIIIYFN